MRNFIDLFDKSKAGVNLKVSPGERLFALGVGAVLSVSYSFSLPSKAMTSLFDKALAKRQLKEDREMIKELFTLAYKGNTKRWYENKYIFED